MHYTAFSMYVCQCKEKERFLALKQISLNGINLTDFLWQENTSITNLNVSWNGFGYEGSIALEDVLKDNTSLKVLDLTNNRITWEGVKHVIRGLKANRTLQVLKVNFAPKI